MMKMLTLVAAFCFALPLFPAQRNFSQIQALKIRQKQERREQQANDKLAKRYLKNRNMPKSVRDHLKRQIKMQHRLLRKKQKRERQALKTERRTMKKGSHSP